MGKNKPLLLDLGGGQQKEKGWTNVDYIKTKEVDVLHDLTVFPWPFKDNSVDQIRSSHLIEHFTGEEFMKFMEECYRILKDPEIDPENPNGVPKNGFMSHLGPYWSSVRCWQDPTHKQALSESKFMYFNKGWREANKLDHYPITCDFNFAYELFYHPEVALKNEEYRRFAASFYVNAISDIKGTFWKNV